MTASFLFGEEKKKNKMKAPEELSRNSHSTEVIAGWSQDSILQHTGDI